MSLVPARALLVFAAVAVLTAMVLPSAHAARRLPMITDLSAVYQVTADGMLHVTETIHYDWGDSRPSWLNRTIRIRKPASGHEYRTADDPDRGKDRTWEVSAISASSPTGANADVSVTELDPLEGGGDDGYDSRLVDLVIEVGRSSTKVPDRTETYVLRYQVRGALDRVPDGYELGWQVDGAGSLGAGRIQARVAVPGTVTFVDCDGYGRECRSSIGPPGARFAVTGSPPETAELDLTVRFPASGIAETGPILVDPPERSSHLTLAGMSVAVLVGVLALAVWRRRTR